MKIGDLVRTIDGKTGRIINLVESSPYWAYELDVPDPRPEKCGTVAYFGWQLTPIETEKPSMLPLCLAGHYCSRKNTRGRCDGAFKCSWQEWFPDSYAQRLQYAPGFEEPKEPLYICEKAEPCAMKNCPGCRYYTAYHVCDRMEECKEIDCPHWAKHVPFFRCTDASTCNVPGEVKCIPYKVCEQLTDCLFQKRER